jgi:pimeloyl-ACP methyl ester carboxylesterase
MTIERDGVRIHYEEHGAGAGTPMLLSHGFCATGRMFASTVTALAAGRRCFTWDLRGHGRSDYPDDADRYSVAHSVGDMLAILDAAGAERAVLLGHSLGGYLSLELQRLHPERVAALVLVGTGPGFRNDDARAGWNEMCEAFAATFEKKGLDGLPFRSEEVEPDAHRDADGLIRAARHLLTQHDGRVLEHLPDITVPTLIVVGEKDRQFLAGCSYMAAKIRGARHVVIDGAGHAPMLTHPQPFLTAATAFLEDIDRSSSSGVQ